MPLITKSEIRKHRQISKSVKDITINQYIDDAQITDLCPLLGEQFYFSILANPSNYEDLLNETEYQYNGATIKMAGLKKVLSLFAYARYILHGTQTDTPFGYVEKQYQDSTPVSRPNRKEIYKSNQQTAMQYWEQVKAYLNRNATDYPFWNSGCSKTKRTFRLNKISR